jgi:phosphate transport system permease protein
MATLSAYDRRRRALSRAVEVACIAAVVMALVPLGFVLYFVLRNGLPALTWAFMTHMPAPVGEKGGGMANAIVGTVIQLGIAGLLGIPVGVISAVYLSEYPKSRLSLSARFAADILNGVPSIVVGIFAYAVAVRPFRHFSAMAGGVALAVMMIPIVVRTTDELLGLVPPSLREGALALGATRGRAVFSVILPAALPGIVTGILVALARVAGETAPLLFTSLGNRFWSTRLDQPIASLTVQIYTYALGPYEEWHQQAWAASAVLIGAVLLFSIMARTVTRRLERMHRP